MRKLKPKDLVKGDMWWEEEFPLVLLSKERFTDPFFDRLVLWKLRWIGRTKAYSSIGIIEKSYTDDSCFKIVSRSNEI